ARFVMRLPRRRRRMVALARRLPRRLRLAPFDTGLPRRWRRMVALARRLPRRLRLALRVDLPSVAWRRLRRAASRVRRERAARRNERARARIARREERTRARIARRDARDRDRARIRLHTNACGDFTLMSREDWLRLRGYPELPIFSLHIDSLLLYMAHWTGIAEVVLPYRVYHVEHDGGFRPAAESRRALDERLERSGVPRLT